MACTARTLLSSATIVLVPLLAGCASQQAANDTIKRYEDQIRTMRADHETAMAELDTQLVLARDAAVVQGRAAARTQREVKAVRVSHRADRITLDAALARLRDRETEVVRLMAEARASGTEGAQKLMQDLVKQNKVLRNQLALARAGKLKPGRDLSAVITASHLDLERPVAWVDRAPLSRRDFVEFLYRDVGAAGYLDLYVNRFLILREAKRREMAVTDVDVAVWVNNQLIAQTTAAGSVEKLTESLAQRGFTRDAWEARLEYQAKTAILVTRLVELNRETPKGREAWKVRLRAAYEESYSEKASASQIVVRLPAKPSLKMLRKARAYLARALEEIESGVPFELVAVKYSQDDSSRQYGGSLGTFDRERFAELPKLNSALFSPRLKVGKLTTVQSRIGLHLVRLDARKKPRKTFAQARGRLTELLLEEPPAEGEVQTLIRALRQATTVKTNLVFD